MASRSKNKTTFAKLAREGRLRERRMEKAARKEARKRAAEDPLSQLGDTDPGENADGELATSDGELATSDGELATSDAVVTSDG